jgi:hypothetical protein
MRPLRSLLHPLWLVSLVVLVVNDHLLKGAGLLPGWLTGKLSDVAGLVVAPAVLAVLLAVRTRRGALLAHLLTGLVFAAINVWPLAARGFEALMALTPFPWVIRVDPTDLLALPALLLSARVLVPAMARPVRTSVAATWAGRAAFLFGAVACMATAPPDEPGVQPDPLIYPQFSDMTGNIAVANDTAESVLLRVRALRESVLVDCAVAAADPESALSRALFAPAVAWTIQPGQAISLNETGTWGVGASGACPAFLVDGANIPMQLVFFRTDDYPPVTLPGSTEGADAARTIFIRGTGELGLSGHPALYPPPPAVEAAPTSACEAAGEEAGVAWAQPVPVGERTLVAATTSPDGCSGLDLEGSGKPTRWYVCHPGVELPFAPGDVLVVGSVGEGQLGYSLDGIDVRSETALLRLGRGPDVVNFGDGGLETAARKGCAGHHDACGTLVIPHVVTLSGEDFEEDLKVSPGEAVTLPSGATLAIARAVEMPIADTDCSPAAESSPLIIDSILVESLAAPKEPGDDDEPAEGDPAPSEETP